MAAVDDALIHLVGKDLVVVVDLSEGIPTIVYWGDPIPAGDIRSLVDRPTVPGTLDHRVPISVVPEHAQGFAGRPGLLGARQDGTAWAPRFQYSHHTTQPDVSSRIEVVSVDAVAALSLITTIEVADTVRISVTIRNDHSSEDYNLNALSISIPIPDDAAELLEFGGRWAREFSLNRSEWRHGTRSRENRRGRTSHDAPSLLVAGTQGFSEWSGEVWGFHLAWSGNHSWLAQHLADGRRYVQFGELLHPGELVLRSGEQYRSPSLIAAHSRSGLTPMSWRFHRDLRARSKYRDRARPVLLNTWEATYFAHDIGRLTTLAHRAAEVGAEVFVLDDGWFGTRRDDSSGLGDWRVSHEVYPDGLTPLIDAVTNLGMRFGIWIEPEMVNPDSDLYRQHPDWAMSVAGYEPVQSRNQLVLDLTRDDAFAYVLNSLDELFSTHDISYVKWDMNRDHIAAGSHGARAGTHQQTMAVYRLIDELQKRHPGINIESCSSGGGRVDHELLSRSIRVWTSDCNDPHDRQRIQFGASIFVPPEMIGSHIGSSRSHTTYRAHDAHFIASSAIFGHLGIECDLSSQRDDDLTRIRSYVEVHKRFRRLLHSGDHVRFDSADAIVAHGVYSQDRTEALISVAALDTSASLLPNRLRIPQLAEHSYTVSIVDPPGLRGTVRHVDAPAWATSPLHVNGALLGTIGLQLPAMYPDSALLIHLAVEG